MIDLTELKKYIGQKFYDVHTEVSNDGMGGHLIRCFDCGGVLGCRGTEEIINSITDLFCSECLVAISNI